MVDFKDKVVKKRIITGTVLTSILALCIAMTAYDPLDPIMAVDDPVSETVSLSVTWLGWLVD